MEQPISRLVFYVLGSVWFVNNIAQRSWQNQFHYSLLEEIRIMNKLQLGQIKRPQDNKEMK
jgi:hypothetical protein